MYMSNYCVCCLWSNKEYPGSKTNESLDLYLLFFLIIFPLLELIYLLFKLSIYSLCRWHRSLQHPHSVIFLLWYSQYTVVYWLAFVLCFSFKPPKLCFWPKIHQSGLRLRICSLQSISNWRWRQVQCWLPNKI